MTPAENKLIQRAFEDHSWRYDGSGWAAKHSKAIEILERDNPFKEKK